MPADASMTRADTSETKDNVDKVVNVAVECGYNYVRLLLYAHGLNINVFKHLLMSDMDAGSSLRWLNLDIIASF
jgi:hypothetical protein